MQRAEGGPDAPATRITRLRLLAGGAAFAGAVTAAAVFANSTAAPPATVVELGAPGAVRATYLDDGSPVFVVSALDGQAHVVSAVEPAARGLVTWCGDTRTFVETGGSSRWDEQGRYLFGAAESGLARHAVAANPNGETVRVGPRLPPRPLSDDPQPVSEEGRCYASGGSGGLRHQLDEIAAQPVDAAGGGTFTRVTGVLSVTANGTARLCAAGDCSAQATTVTSMFHGTVALDEYVGEARGEFLVRATPQGTFEDLVDLDGVLDMLQLVSKPTPFSPADVTAELVEVTTSESGSTLVMARPARPRPSFPDGPAASPPSSRTWPIAEDATIISLTTQGQYPYADFLTVAQLQERVAQDGPLPVEVHLDGHGVGVSLRPVAATGP